MSAVSTPSEDSDYDAPTEVEVEPGSRTTGQRTARYFSIVVLIVGLIPLGSTLFGLLYVDRIGHAYPRVPATITSCTDDSSHPKCYANYSYNGTNYNDVAVNSVFIDAPGPRTIVVVPNKPTDVMDSKDVTFNWLDAASGMIGLGLAGAGIFGVRKTRRLR